jgi:hypothetical protein
VKTAFTPGPWEVRLDHDEGLKRDWRSIVADGGRTSVVRPDSYSTNKWGERETVCGMWVTEANANLIAAAPDLYEALDEMVKVIEQYIIPIHERENPGTPLPEPDFISKARASLSKANGEVE